MPMKTNLTENIDLDRAVYDPEYRHAVMRQLRAQRQRTATDVPSAPSGPDGLGAGTPRAAGEV